MEKDFSVAPFKVGDWVLVGGKITQASKALIAGNPADIRDIALTPEILCDLGFCRAFGPCPDGTFNFWLESESGYRFACNLDLNMIRLEDILYRNAASVRGLQHIIAEDNRRSVFKGEFSFLVRRINKLFKIKQNERIANTI